MDFYHSIKKSDVKAKEERYFKIKILLLIILLTCKIVFFFFNFEQSIRKLCTMKFKMDRSVSAVLNYSM